MSKRLTTKQAAQLEDCHAGQEDNLEVKEGVRFAPYALRSGNCQE